MSATAHELIGKPAPTFTLPNQDGVDYTLHPGQGKPIALFFYPKSGTYGCTREACAFRDSQKLEVYQSTQVEVVGVSADDVKAQKKFVDDHQLGYNILSDKDRKVRELYKVPKGLLGLSDGMCRTTFVIDKTGNVRDVCDGVMNYSGHVKFVEKWLTTFSQEDKPAESS
ncbi:peroxiredoxin Q [Dacryopinax primogenitus]|uniref:thioredoxin-dependent peroxiredoxin n=1 Tax=Dacryopinax primogenitus (strain DJM 731) TaxID=1858805 RepID=M5FPK2_DACPD|nr:peroxiredoxin Q [Dacryopinax primogenitus]EJT98625.1 peroxiredoxin Q [Dacryopinax primogenitus]